MMDALRGESGLAGSAASLPAADWSHWSAFGIGGRGTLQIGTPAGTLTESLVWCPENRVESEAKAHSDWNDAKRKPQEGGQAQDPLPVHPHFRRKSVDEALGVPPNRIEGPIQFVWKLLEFWRLEEHDAAALLGFNPEDRDHIAAVLCGRDQLRGRDARDRISHLFWIRKALWSFFQDLDVENDWLREPHTPLEGRSPLALLLGGSMEDLLLTREYVDAATGR